MSEEAPKQDVRLASSTRRDACAFLASRAADGAPAGVSVDLAREADTEYTAPYAVIEGAYLVRDASPLQRNEEVDRPGTRVAVGRGSAPRPGSRHRPGSATSSRR